MNACQMYKHCTVSVVSYLSKYQVIEISKCHALNITYFCVFKNTSTHTKYTLCLTSKNLENTICTCCHNIHHRPWSAIKYKTCHYLLLL